MILFTDIGDFTVAFFRLLPEIPLRHQIQKSLLVKPTPRFCLQHWQLRRGIPAQENLYVRPVPQMHLSMQATCQEHVRSSST